MYRSISVISTWSSRKFWEVLRVFIRYGDTAKIGDRDRSRRPSFRSPNPGTCSPSSAGRFFMARDTLISAAIHKSTDTSGSQSRRGQPVFCISSTKMWYSMGRPKRGHRSFWVGTRPVTVAV